MLQEKRYKKNIILFSIFILGISSLLIIKPIESFDYWWHIKAGEYIVQNRTIPFTDVFSWIGSQNNFHWYSHEWLSEVTLYLFNYLFGKWGGYIFSTILFLGISILLFLFNKDGYLKNIKFSIIWTVIGILVLIPIFTPRPHMISLLLFLITLYLIMDYRNNENSKKIWFVPLISVLWVNFHGGSSNLPYIMIFMFIISGLFNFKIGKIVSKKLNKKQLKTLSIVGVLSILALILNPHGVNMIAYPYINMGDSFMLFNIDEWRSPDLKMISDLFVFIEIFIIGMVLIINEEEISFFDLLFEIAFLYLTFKSIRFSAFLHIVTTFIIFKYIKKCDDNIFTINLLRGISCIGVLTLIMSIFEVSSIGNEPIKTPVAPHIIETIKEENPKRLYNTYNLGGYLIYNDIKVFIDGRADMYSENGTLEDAMDFARVRNNPKEIIDKYDFDLFLVYKDSPIDYYLKNNNNYKDIDEDDNFIVYKEK